MIPCEDQSISNSSWFLGYSPLELQSKARGFCQAILQTFNSNFYSASSWNLLKALLSFSASQLPLPVMASPLGKTQLQMLVHLFDFPSFSGSWLLNSLPTYLFSDTFRNVVFISSPDFLVILSWRCGLHAYPEEKEELPGYDEQHSLYSLGSSSLVGRKFVIEAGGLGSLS